MRKLQLTLLLSLLSLAPLAGEYFGGIFLDSSIPSQQTYLLKEDLSYLYQKSELAGDLALTKELFELEEIDGPILYNWIYNRVKFIIGEEYVIRRRDILTQSGFTFPSSPLPYHAFDKVDAYGGVVIMSNVGAGLYLEGKRDRKLKGLKINRKKVFAKTPRVGILQVGEGLFLERLLINGDMDSEANRIKRVGTLVHEARHSDGSGEHVGFIHSKCPVGHTLSGFDACEPYKNGAYSLEAALTKNLLEDCKTCSIEDKTKLEVAVADSFDRVVVLSHSKTEEELLNEMKAYKQVIDFYIGFIEMSPSQAETSKKELERFTLMFNESKAQLEELKNKPNPKTLSSTPEGSFNERDVDYSSNLIERSLR